MRWRGAGALLLVALLAGCGMQGPNEQREWLMHDGVWGWQKGAGCDGLSDAWVVQGKWIEMYKDGKRVDRAMLERRSILTGAATAGTTSGKTTGIIWEFIARDPDAPDQLGRHKLRFSLKGRMGRTVALRAWKKREFISAETRQTTRIKDPRAGQLFAPCMDVFAPPLQGE